MPRWIEFLKGNFGAFVPSDVTWGEKSRIQSFPAYHTRPNIWHCVCGSCFVLFPL